MELYTAQEVLAHWAEHETDEAKAERREIEDLRKDIKAAEDAIEDAIARYRKAKTKARSKAKANGEDLFADLAGYKSEKDIQDAYGWEFISEKEMDRLLHLWRLREQSKTPTIYTDRVIEMLEATRQSIFTKYGSKVLEYDEKASLKHREAKRIAEENFRNRT